MHIIQVTKNTHIHTFFILLLLLCFYDFTRELYSYDAVTSLKQECHFPQLPRKCYIKFIQ